MLNLASPNLFLVSSSIIAANLKALSIDAEPSGHKRIWWNNDYNRGSLNFNHSQIIVVVEFFYNYRYTIIFSLLFFEAILYITIQLIPNHL